MYASGDDVRGQIDAFGEEVASDINHLETQHKRHEETFKLMQERLELC